MRLRYSALALADVVVFCGVAGASIWGAAQAYPREPYGDLAGSVIRNAAPALRPGRAGEQDIPTGSLPKIWPPRE
jgi:hypothetical protein